MINTYDFFFYRFGRFPGDLDLVQVPQGEIPKFIKTTDIISPVVLNKKFSIGDIRGVVCMQFMTALNISLGGDSKISKDARNEFFHNLSKLALSKSDDSILTRFASVSLLVKKY